MRRCLHHLRFREWLRLARHAETKLIHHLRFREWLRLARHAETKLIHFLLRWEKFDFVKNSGRL